MTKRLSSKLLAVILTLAICATTVLGCLITAYAADNSVYEFGTAEFATDDLTKATIDVTFTAPATMPNGFTVGEFTLTEVDKNNSDYLTFTSVVPKDEKINITGKDNKYIFNVTGVEDSGVDPVVNTATFTVTVGFSKGEATKGKVYKLKLTGVSLAYSDDDYINQDNANGSVAKISATCQHEIAVVGDPVATGVGGDYGYAVYQKSKCTVCGEQFGYQLVPTADNLNGGIIYWDGTKATGFSDDSTGTADDPIIIKTAPELAYLVSADGNSGSATPSEKITVTAFADGSPKYFKIDDSIGAIVLQSEDKAAEIMALDSAAEVKEYFEDSSKGTFNRWIEKGWERTTFCGNFDGNGVTIYGLYSVSASNAGLFSTVDAGATIKNIAVKNSYITSTSENYQVGAIAAVASATDYGAKKYGAIWINGCTVANCYLRNKSEATDSQTRSGIVFGSASYDVVTIDNCLVYGNNGKFGANYANNMSLIGMTAATLSAGATIPNGLDKKETTTDQVGVGICLYSMVRNSIILDCDVMNTTRGRQWGQNNPDCYTNVYTNGASGKVVFKNNTTEIWNYDGHLIPVTDLSTLKGSAAQSVVDTLNAGNGENATVWSVGGEGEYPTLGNKSATPVSRTSNPDFAIVGTNLVYNDDGSFGINIHYIPPYEGFAPTLYVGDANCTKLYILDTPVASSQREAIGDDTAMMFTLSGISAKNIDKVWYPTLVAQNGGTVDWSKSAEISVAQTATATLTGDNYSTADKNVAAAVLQYGDASKAALSAANDSNKITIYWDGTKATEFSDDSEGTADDPIIIKTAAELAYLVSLDANSPTELVTRNKYYKIADDIGTIVLQPEDKATEIMAINSASAVKNYFESGDTTLKKWVENGWNKASFSGTFDGNGATVYGIYNPASSNAGLFSTVDAGTTIKNISVKNSYFTSARTDYNVGAIAALSADNSYGGKNDGMIWFSGCTVANCYLRSKNINSSQAGILFGNLCDAVTIDNCLVYGNDGYYGTNYENKMSLVGKTRECKTEGAIIPTGLEYNTTDKLGQGNSLCNNINNSVILGCDVINVPYGAQWGRNDQSCYANVYTDGVAGTIKFSNATWTYSEAQLKAITADDAKGHNAKANMPALDWDTVWTTTDGYPTFISKDYTNNSKTTIYWDGTKATSVATGEGTKDNPYIIKTAAELAYIVSMGCDDWEKTAGKYYKVDDSIGAIVLQKEDKAADIMALDSAAAVKAYFEAEGSSFLSWYNYGWEVSTFCGDIDFNGVTIYGLYMKSINNAGLISNADAGAALHNVALKNSYMTSTVDNYNVGGLVAITNGGPSSWSKGYGRKVNGAVWFDGCVVANNYMYNPSTDNLRSGVIIGNSQDYVYMDNCMTYGNDATYGNSVAMPIWATAHNSVAVSDDFVAPEGLMLASDTNNLYYNKARNCIFFDAKLYNKVKGFGSRFNDPNCFENVFTDADVANDKFGATDKQIKTITASELLGNSETAKNIVNTLNTANGSTVWYVGATGDYPGHSKATALGNRLQAAYDGITFTPDTYKSHTINDNKFGVYATAVNLNSNPYVSFAFEFSGDLKEIHDQFTFTFTYTQDGQSKTYTTSCPEYENDSELINGTNGWYHKESAGRFHTFRFKNIPVEALTNPITVKATYNGNEYDLGTFSVAGLGYELECQNKVTPCNYYTARIDAVKSLLFYAQMIEARYGKSAQ